jgi:predicted nucleic acid-binding protein
VIQLDTSYLIRALVKGSPQDQALRSWLRSGEPLAMSAIAWGEFLCGPADPGQVELAARLIPERVPFTEDDAALAARLFNDSGRRRGSFVDCMISATAIRAESVLATANPDDFRRFEKSGLTFAMS